MGNLWARESFVNVTKGYRFGDGDWFETFADSTGALYRSCNGEYGRCVSKMYRDRDGKLPIVCGWVFQKRMRYEDARGNRPEDHYIREVWVEVSTTEPRKYVEWRDVNSPFEGIVL